MTEHEKPRREDCIETVLPWLQHCDVRPQRRLQPLAVPETVGLAIDQVVSRRKRQTFQEAKALKHRVQIEAITSQCLSCITPDLVLELGAGQGILGQTLSLASGQCPLVVVDRRANTDAFDEDFHSETAEMQSFCRIQEEIQNLSEETMPQLQGAKQILLVAKHLCGHGTDEAIDLAIKLKNHLGLLCLAPCCYVTMRWDQLTSSSKKWFEERSLGLGKVILLVFKTQPIPQNACLVRDSALDFSWFVPPIPGSFPGTAQAFDLLIDLIRFARNGAATACARWRLRQEAAEEEVRQMGRKACGVIDEARLQRLEAEDFEVMTLEYCASETSPDNVLLLARPKMAENCRLPCTLSGQGGEDGGVRTHRTNGFGSSILLELDPTAPPTMATRLAAYLLSQKAQGERRQLMSVVAESPMDGAMMQNALFCLAMDPSRLHELIEELAKDVLLQRVVTRFLPLSDFLEVELSGVVEKLTKILEELSNSQKVTLRVAAKPRSLEKAICQFLPSNFLSPTHFTHLLSILELTPNISYSFAITPRDILDPGSYTAASKVASSLAHSFQRFDEHLRRARPPATPQAPTAVALWTDVARPAAQGGEGRWLLRCAEEYQCDVAMIKCEQGSGEGRLMFF